jgi:hypothetical protein
MGDMKTVERVVVTRLFPLGEQQVVMAHVAPDLGRDWLGPVVLVSNGRRIAMDCVGVGETGNEVVVMLRPPASDSRSLDEISVVLCRDPTCPLVLERVTHSG